MKKEAELTEEERERENIKSSKKDEVDRTT